MAAVLSGHLTKLQAVNDILWSIGELPVNSLESGLGDAEIAEAQLDRLSREIQLKGWQVNTTYAATLTKNISNQFTLPENTLRVDTSSRRSSRQTSSPIYSSHLNAHMKRSADDTKWLMYDGDNNSETWTTPDEMTVDIVKLLEFANLTPALQLFIWTAAAHRFQKGAMGSRVLTQYTAEMVFNAEIQAVQEDSANEDLNVIRDNPHVRSIAYRNNPGFNR
jgi:hypothetical protein